MWFIVFRKKFKYYILITIISIYGTKQLEINYFIKTPTDPGHKEPVSLGGMVRAPSGGIKMNADLEVKGLPGGIHIAVLPHTPHIKQSFDISHLHLLI